MCQKEEVAAGFTFIQGSWCSRGGRIEGGLEAEEGETGVQALR